LIKNSIELLSRQDPQSFLVRFNFDDLLIAGLKNVGGILSNSGQSFGSGVTVVVLTNTDNGNFGMEIG